MAFVLQVFFNEGSGRLECEDGGDPGTTTKYVLQNLFIFVWQMIITCRYLTSKLVADSLMWQQTFRNDSPSPEEWPDRSPEEVDLPTKFCIHIYLFKGPWCKASST